MSPNKRPRLAASMSLPRGCSDVLNDDGLDLLAYVIEPRYALIKIIGNLVSADTVHCRARFAAITERLQSPIAVLVGAALDPAHLQADLVQLPDMLVFFFQ